MVSTRFLAVLALATVLGWFGFGYRWRRGRRRWPAALVATLLSLVLVGDGVNSYFSYLPNVSDVVDAVVSSPPRSLPTTINQQPASAVSAPRHGKLFRLQVPDNGSGFGQSQAWVWLPPQYFEPGAGRLPVLYLFHGSPGMPKDWFHGGSAGRIAQAMAQRNQPVIVVAPQMSKGWLDDPECVDGIHEKVESHLMIDVIPTVDRRLRTLTDRTGRIFAGMSAGGYCALNLGLRHRDQVATVLDLSGLTEPTHAGGLPALFGRQHLTAAASNSPDQYARSLAGGPPMRIWLDSGSSDRQVSRQMDAIAPVLRADGMVVIRRDRPGDHTYSVWRPALRDSLTWALTGLPTA